jgi:type II secretory pathway predicted ATPase ExeA
MFEGHFGLRENPFVAAHQSRYIYPSPEHQEALAHLRYGIENREPFVLITGEVGTGKTTALFDALSEWEGRAVVGLITNSSLTRAELLEEIALRLGMTVPQNASKPLIMVALERHLLAIHQEGLRAILLLDEAQNLERELLEEIRLLSNLESGGEKLVQIFLVGQPELEGRLGRPELRQLRQRIAIHYRLRPLGAADAERYIHHRIAVAGGHALSIFPPNACAEVHRLTNGIPREMNHLCSQAMICAFVESAPAVTLEHVRAAAQELEFQSVLGKERRTRNIAPAIERRQGPTIPGAAPPPEREMRFGGPRSHPPSAMHAPPVALSHRTAAPPEVGTDPAPQGPPRWEPDELGGDAGDDDESFGEHRAPDLGDAERAEDAAPEPGVLEEAEAPESGPPRLEPQDIAPERAAPEPSQLEEAEAPESGPPRLGPQDVAPAFRETGTSSAQSTAGDARAEAAEAAPTGQPGLDVSGPQPPAPAASGDDWQSWFKSLAREAESAVEARPTTVPESSHDDAASLSPLASEPPFFEHPVAAQLPESPALSAPDDVAPPTAPIVEPAASTSAFAAALRRAQVAQAPPADTGAAHDAAVLADDTPPPAPVRRPRRLGEEDVAFETLAPRLREKMARHVDVPRESNPLLARIMIAAALLTLVIAGAFLVQRFLLRGAAPGPDVERAGAASPGSEGAGSAADAGGGAPAGTATSTPPANDPVAQPPARGTPEPASATAPTGSPTPAPEPAAPPAGAPTFSLGVGTYLNEARARAEQARLTENTPYPARVATVQDDGVAMYHVTMGSFTTRVAAERAASDLISRGLVDEARVLRVAPADR